MDSPTAASTPQYATPPPAMRRSFTLPPRLNGSPKLWSPNQTIESEGVETLFAHNSGKIVSFESSSSTTRPRPISGHTRGEPEAEAVGTTPWASRTERTIAVAFLNSGSTLHPILAKSQCWCVDGETKFVLRIRQNSFYRIELPNNGEEDKVVANELKLILAKVLQYETTPCPFKRGFTVELPEAPKTPVRKRPWKPTERPEARKYETVWESDEYVTAASDNSDRNSTDSDDSDATNDADKTPRVSVPRSTEPQDVFQMPARPRVFGASRSITAPPQLTIRTSPPSGTAIPIQRQNMTSNETSSLSSSVESFQSFNSFHSPVSPLPPSPPYSNPSSPPLPPSELEDDIDVPRRRQHKRDVSELTITANSPRNWETMTSPDSSEDDHTSPVPVTPTLVSDTENRNDEDWSEVVTPPQSTELRYRRSTTSRRRALSPLPSPANLFSPSSCRSGHHLTTAIIQKTCSVLLGPPAQLIALMLNIASKIVNGAKRGVAFGYGERGEKIPCQWDFSDADDVNDERWGEDDYGIPLGRIVDGTKRTDMGGSWEVD
ncbi:MAG: hypothetical protein M1827_000009 [Pycnora praestabilis]|nr:MAG: hypothetical protein M1827_000009 [Pycnora praestabilis]